MSKYKCKQCGYKGDRLIFQYTEYGYCIASNDNVAQDVEYIKPAPKWVTAGDAEIGSPVGCPKCHNWGEGGFELIEEAVNA